MGSDAKLCLQLVAEHGPAISAASLKAMTCLDVVMKVSHQRYRIVGRRLCKALRHPETLGCVRPSGTQG